MLHLQFPKCQFRLIKMNLIIMITKMKPLRKAYLLECELRTPIMLVISWWLVIPPNLIRIIFHSLVHRSPELSPKILRESNSLINKKQKRRIVKMSILLKSHLRKNHRQSFKKFKYLMIIKRSHLRKRLSRNLRLRQMMKI